MHHAKEKSLRDRPHQRGASRIGSAVEGLKRGLTAFQRRYQRSAKPFKWTFTRRDLDVLLVKLKSHNVAPHKKIRSRNTSP